MIMDEEQLIYQLIIHPAGFDIDIAGALIIRRYEYPMWAVEWEDYILDTKSVQVKEFTDPLEAVSFFCKKRLELQLGLDFGV